MLDAPAVQAGPPVRAVRESRMLAGGKAWIRVRTTSYSPGEIQPLVDSLAALPHGSELGHARLFVATPEQLERTCGVAAMGCYDPFAKQIFVSGDPQPVAGIPRDFVLAHEYGHHIANHRGNAPWTALHWGPKRWATHLGICARVRRGDVHPGNQGARYWSNPGEAFAQSYAHFAVPSVQAPWYYHHDLAPSAGALRALHLDVTDPVKGPRLRHWRVRIGRGDRSRIRRVATALDGRFRVAVREGRGRKVSIRLLAADSRRVLARSWDAGRREILRYDVCARRAVRLEVRLLGGSGSVVTRILSH